MATETNHHPTQMKLSKTKIAFFPNCMTHITEGGTSTTPVLTWTSSGRYLCFMERSMARLSRWLRASTTSRGSRASASLMSRSWYGSYRSSYRSPVHRRRQQGNRSGPPANLSSWGSRGRLAGLARNPRHLVGAGKRRPGLRERTVFAEAGSDGVPVESRERVPARVQEPRRQLGEHLWRSFWKVGGLVTRVCL